MHDGVDHGMQHNKKTKIDGKHEQHHEKNKNYQRFKLDPRLLRRALTGPHLANWNNIEIGAHIDFDRQPDVFRYDIHVLVNALHV